jgi:hypothetical protein
LFSTNAPNFRFCEPEVLSLPNKPQISLDCLSIQPHLILSAYFSIILRYQLWQRHTNFIMPSLLLMLDNLFIIYGKFDEKDN